MSDSGETTKSKVVRGDSPRTALGYQNPLKHLTLVTHACRCSPSSFVDVRQGRTSVYIGNGAKFEYPRIIIIPGSHLYFLANKNAKQASLTKQTAKKRGNVPQLSDSTVYSPRCNRTPTCNSKLISSDFAVNASNASPIPLTCFRSVVFVVAKT